MGCASGKETKHTSDPKITSDQTTVVKLPLIKLCVTGDIGVGKSSLLRRFIENTFLDETLPTVEAEVKTKQIQLDQKNYKILMYDSTGQERDRTVTRPNYPKPLGGLILVYDITNRESFNSVPLWIVEMKTLTSQDISISIVGNKTDLNAARQVSTEEGKKMADSQGAMFTESSAKDNINVEKIFTYLCTDSIAKQKVAM